MYTQTESKKLYSCKYSIFYTYKNFTSIKATLSNNPLQVTVYGSATIMKCNQKKASKTKMIIIKIKIMSTITIL